MHELLHVGQLAKADKVIKDAKLMREKKWVRGRTYVADGLELEVYGKTYEGMGKVWSEKEKR